MKNKYGLLGKLGLITLTIAALSWLAAIITVGVLSKSILYITLIVIGCPAFIFGYINYMMMDNYDRKYKGRRYLYYLSMGVGVIMAYWTMTHVKIFWAWAALCLLQILPIYIFQKQETFNNRIMDNTAARQPNREDRVTMASRATNMRDYASALGLNYIPASRPVVRPLTTSQFAARLTCQHCSQPQAAREWPVNGDMVPFYSQKEPGKYSLKITCLNCGKDWYLAWDQDPGQFMPLS